MSLDVDLRVVRPGWSLSARVPEVAGVVALLGPSGVGKTTLLHAIAGLVPSTGSVRLHDVEVGALPAHRRGIGVVFQEPRLLPHLTVAGNLRYGAVDPAEVAPTAARLGVAHALDRRPSTLSGGEARRVALARTLLARPRALLLDEPLTGLDPARRDDVLGWLRDLLRTTGLPTVWVTHDVAEAQAVADRLVVLGAAPDGARVVADGDAGALLGAGVRAGVRNALDVVEVAVGPDGVSGRWSDVTLALPAPPAGVLAAGRGRVLLAPEEPVLAVDPPGRTSARNVLGARVDAVLDTPDGVTLRLVVGDHALAVDLTRAAVRDLGLAPGVAVHVLVKARALTWAG